MTSSSPVSKFREDPADSSTMRSPEKPQPADSGVISLIAR
jgi:hypothetical protein